jgi:heterotetrameric sarcosine oxidase delta subunit
MLLIECPHCGPRNESEFRYGDQAHIARPENNEGMSDQEWAEYVYLRENPKGLFRERWCHTAGCGQWFNAVRDTVSSRIMATYKAGEEAPISADQEGGQL